ncbi:MAG: IclR family transcriptional regulator [Burkholderiales bacterium]
MKRSDGEFSLTVSRALQLVGLFSAERLELGISELARELKLSKTSVHRLVQALERHQFLDHNPHTRKYRVGVEAFRVGSLFSRPLERDAEPLMRDLVANTGFTSYLSLLRNDAMVITASVEGSGRIRYSIPVGEQLPLHSTATGKAALSMLEEEAVESIVKRVGLPRRTANTTTDLRKFKGELATVRTRGYSVNWEENTPGIASVAAPIKAAVDGVIPVVSIGFATSQADRKDVPALGARVAKAANEIGKRYRAHIA